LESFLVEFEVSDLLRGDLRVAVEDVG